MSLFRATFKMRSAYAAVLFLLQVSIGFSFGCSIPPEWISASKSSDLLYTTNLPRDGRLFPALGNGYLGQQFGDPYLYMVGVYLGNGLISNGAVRARIPNPLVILPNLGVYAAAIDFRRAAFYTIHCDPAFPTTIVSTKTYAHRLLRSLWVHEMSFSNLANSDAELLLSDHSLTKSPDTNSTFHTTQSYNYLVGNVNRPEAKSLKPQQFAVVSSLVPNTVSIPAASTVHLKFIAAMRSSVDSDNVLVDALNDFQAASSKLDQLFLLHIEDWAEMWNGNVHIEGNQELALKVNASLYALYSSVRADLPWAPSPGGLTPGYSGNVFWDSDLWIMPSILPFHPNMSKACVDYRVNRIPAAQKRAIAFNYRGAFFPWQSAFSGSEVDWFPLFNYLEQHVGADISISARLQAAATADVKWMRTNMWPLVSNIADFWVSRVVKSKTHPGQYDLIGVVPPDEFAVGFPLYSGVQNSAYTNGAAKEAIRIAMNLASFLNKTVPAEWVDVSSNLMLPLSSNPSHHPEYDGFPGGNTYFEQYVKQADVVLLQYPVELSEALSNASLRLGDLDYYEPYMSPNGPAMTWSALSLLWADLGDYDTAARYLNQSSSNVLPPFSVWSEVIDPSNPGFDAGILNFITGAGGFIQAIVNGYSGLRYRFDGHTFTATFKPALLPGATAVKWRSIKFAGSTFDISVSSQASIKMTSSGPFTITVQINNQPPKEFLPGTTVSFAPKTTIMLASTA